MSPSSATEAYGYCSICGHLNNDLSVCNCAGKTLQKVKWQPPTYGGKTLTCPTCGLTYQSNGVHTCTGIRGASLHEALTKTKKLSIDDIVSHIDSLPEVGPKYDTGKLRYDLVTPDVIKAIAEVLTFGAEKYAPNSWQLVPDAKRRYTAALMRHFEAYRAGEKLDHESGLSHLSHALCNLMFLQHFEKESTSKHN